MTWAPPVDRAVAYVNHGRWVADCPDPNCPGAEDTRPRADRLIGLNRHRLDCSVCGRTWPVDWPDHPDAIVTVLMARPDAATRNWWPWETVADLIAENTHHLRGA